MALLGLGSGPAWCSDITGHILSSVSMGVDWQGARRESWADVAGGGESTGCPRSSSPFIEEGECMQHTAHPHTFRRRVKAGAQPANFGS